MLTSKIFSKPFQNLRDTHTETTQENHHAHSFVPFYAQRLSTACVLNGARGIQKSLKRKADRRRSATTAA